MLILAHFSVFVAEVCQICLNADQLLMELQNSQARISYCGDLRSTAIPSGGVIKKCWFLLLVVYFLTS